MAKIAHLVLWLLILALLFFTAMRTIHFLSLTFPPDQQYMPWLGLAAFDGGVLLWFLFAKYGAKGWQRAIAYIMVFICLTGVVICTWADMSLVAATNGLVKLPPNTADTALFGVRLIIVVNVVAGVLVHMVSPDALRQWKVESAHDKIEEQTLKYIDQSASLNAPNIAQQLAQQWQAQTYQNLMLPVPDDLPMLAPPKKKVGLFTGILNGKKATEDAEEQTGK